MSKNKGKMENHLKLAPKDAILKVKSGINGELVILHNQNLLNSTDSLSAFHDIRGAL